MLASVIGFAIFEYDNALKMALVISAGFSYFVWGIVHHYIHKDISVDIIFEYLFVCLFGVAAIIFLIK